jgi:hypothetical protein
MVRKRFILFRDQIRDFCRKRWERKVMFAKDDLMVVEVEVPEEDGPDRNTMQIEDLMNEPKRW